MSDLPLTRYALFQQAYVVNDLEEGARRWHRVLGAGPFFVARHHKADRFLYRGEPVEAEVSYAFGYLGEMMIQLVEQHDDTPSIYREMYPRGHEGFHHVGTLVPDGEGFQREKLRFVELGFEVACELYADGVDACYVDTRAVTGGFTELHGDPAHILKAFARWKQAHAEWDGSGGSIRG